MTQPAGERDRVQPREFEPAAAVPLAEEADADSMTLPVPVDGEEAAPRSTLGRWLAAGVCGVVLVALGFDSADLLTRAVSVSWALGAIVGAALAAALGASGTMLVREFLSLRRLRQIEALRGEADRLRTTFGHGEAERFAGELASLYERRRDLASALDRLRNVVTDAHDDGEIVRLIDREVLADLDRRAYQLAVRAARDTALVTALSPAAIIDVSVVLWRNLKLVRDVAALYGARPGYVGSLRLLRRMLANLAVAGVTESAHHAAVDALGGSLAAAISTRIGQGVINGLLTARVGLAAMHLCRPISFTPETRPSLGRIRAELLTLPKDVL